MRKIVQSNSFKKDLKRVKKRHLDLSCLEEVVNKLANDEELDERFKDHQLQGDLNWLRECHIKPDWLLLYRIDDEEIELFLFRTGTHSDLFD